ncbi:MAG: hypothetical protein KDC27_13025 [Acidobacteria bacterium]|nr:hypothetical protein [Acidobacteriota bacterium]
MLPLRLHPDNPHYFQYERKPAVLVTSGEHYGALLNPDFDFKAYFAELELRGLNHTRIFAGTYFEVPGNFNIGDNTLAPAPGRFLGPWARSETPGAADGGAKFDLTRWSPEYFARLHALMQEAEQRGIVVELTLFCPFYNDTIWQVSPFNAANNVNGVGEVEREDALTLKSAPLVEAQKAVARKIVSELHATPNLYFEICNEPYTRDLVPDDWQREMAAAIAEADREGPAPHLISQNYANGSKTVESPNPLVSLYNFHYTRPPDAVAMNYGLNVAIGMNETGFDGQTDSTYRVQGWDFLMAGGALYNNLDYSFAVGHEAGDLRYTAATPGGGSELLRRQLGFLRRFFGEMPFVAMAPDAAVIAIPPEGASARALSAPGAFYAIYAHHGRIVAKAKPCYQVDKTLHRKATLTLNLPPGAWAVTWADPKSTAQLPPQKLEHPGGPAELAVPPYIEDFAVTLRKLE